MNNIRMLLVLLCLSITYPAFAQQAGFVLPGETARTALVEVVEFNRVEGHLFYDKGVSGGRIRSISATPRKTASGIMLVFRSPVEPDATLSYFSRHAAFDTPIDVKEKACVYYAEKDGQARVIETWLPGQRGYGVACQRLLIENENDALPPPQATP